MFKCISAFIFVFVYLVIIMPICFENTFKRETNTNNRSIHKIFKQFFFSRHLSVQYNGHEGEMMIPIRGWGDKPSPLKRLIVFCAIIFCLTNKIME